MFYRKREEEESVRFNELHKTLGKMGVKLSKPALSEHLKHLEAKELIVRKEEGVQNVSYIINIEKYLGFEGFLSSLKTLTDNIQKGEKAFSSSPIEKQVTGVITFSVLKNLIMLKVKILRQFEQADRAKYFAMSITLAFLEHSFFSHYEELLTAKCFTDREYGKKALGFIDEQIDKIMSAFFPEYKKGRMEFLDTHALGDLEQ